MTGFSAAWLALREPADHAARNREVLAATSRLFARHDAIRVLDLGSGSGSNLRGLAEHLPHRQAWRLVDYDPSLIAAARTALSAWGTGIGSSGEVLSLRKGDRLIDVAFQRADLSASLEEILDGPVDLVTAAAFFDLVSADWIARFVARLAARRLPLYTVLIYDGEERWDPGTRRTRPSTRPSFDTRGQTRVLVRPRALQRPAFSPRPCVRKAMRSFLATAHGG